MKRYIAEVIDNNHPDQDGRVQVYVEHLHHDIIKEALPWAKQDREWTSNIPEVGEYVWIYFLEEDFHRQCFYQNKVNLKSYHSHNESIGSLTGSYPNIKYIQLANGCSIAMNSDDPEITIYHPSAEIFIDSNGYITVEDGTGTNKIEMNASGIKITTGDASGWKPNSLSVDPFSGAPHFTSVKLTGG